MPPTKPATAPASIPKNEWYVPLRLAPLQSLLGKGLPRGTITAMYGPPKAYKTTLCAEISVDVATTDGDVGNVLVFDTEMGAHAYLELLPMLEAKFGVKVNLVKCKADVKNAGNKSNPNWTAKFSFQGEPKKGLVNLFVLTCPDVIPISHLHGRGLFFDVSPASGKVKIGHEAGSFAPTIDKSPLGAFVQKHDIRIVVYDSITSPTDEIPAVGENFPARSDLTQIWMLQIEKIAEHFNIPILAIGHESKNETNPFNFQIKLEGGKGISYNTKWTIYISPSPPGTKWGSILPPGSTSKPGPIPPECRHLFMDRSCGELGWKRFVTIERTDKGFVPYDGLGAGKADEEETTTESPSEE